MSGGAASRLVWAVQGVGWVGGGAAPAPPRPPIATPALLLLPCRRPDADGTMYAGGHFAIADATGAGLLLEALPDGSFTTYDTAVVTNEPSWPLMMEWR